MTAIGIIPVVLMVTLLPTCLAFIQDHSIREETNETSTIEMGGVFAPPINGPEAQSLRTADTRRNLEDTGMGQNLRHERLNGVPLKKTEGRRDHRSGGNNDDDDDDEDDDRSSGRQYPSHLEIDRDPLHDSQVHRWASCLGPDNCYLAQRGPDNLADGNSKNESTAPISFVITRHELMESDEALQGKISKSITGCGSFDVPNGKLDTVNGTLVGDTSSMYCNDGYKLHGESTVMCTPSGEWSVSGLCVIVDCSEPPVPPGASVSMPNGTKYGAEVYLSCSTGYTMRGNSNITCRDNGTWSVLPSCEIIDCGSLTIVNGKMRAQEGTTFGKTATMACDDGYNLQGNLKLKCTSTGKWDGSAKCTAKDCGSLTIVNGKMRAQEGTTFGNTATLSCDDGYNVQGDSKVKCTSIGKWDGSATCKAKDCGQMTIVDGKMNAPEGTMFGDTATITCDIGYTIVGNVQLKCASTGHWDGSASCKAKYCGSLTIVNGKMRAQEGTTFGNMATVSCDDGYDVQGDAEVKCTSTGKWDGKATCTAKDCGSMVVIHGKMSAPKGTTFGNTATVSCDDGYDLHGNNEVKCTSTGKWDGSPTCKAKDCLRPTIRNGQISVAAGTTFGKVAKISCDYGFKLLGDAEVTCTSSGQWGGSASCVPRECGNPTAGSNMDIEYYPDQISFGDRCRVICHAGFYTNTEHIYCNGNGLWDTPYCQPKDCGPPPYIANGKIIPDVGGTTFRSTAQLTCILGYEPRLGLNGRAYSPGRVYLHTCSADGKWWTQNPDGSAYVESSDLKCTEINECASNPCKNNGQCVDEINGWSCNCDRNHGGKDCNTDIGQCSRNPCQNGGTCFYDARGVDYCSCTEHWENRICSSYHRRGRRHG